MALKGAGVRLLRYVQVCIHFSGEHDSILQSVFYSYGDCLDLTMSSIVPRLTSFVDSPLQFHQDQTHMEQIAPMLTDGMAPAPYDGIAEFHAKDISHLKKFFGKWLLFTTDNRRC
jgi:hypothetical protein